MPIWWIISSSSSKLASFNRKIGYPDKWRDYSQLQVERAPFATNILHARQFGIKRSLEKIGKPVDRGEWFMTPPTVNAYYSPQMNEVVFPAGRLQSPFFHPTYDEAANYGGIGGTIGHEMSHGFDDQGRQFDARGNLRDWWTTEDARRYTERATVVEKQYDAYTVLDTVHVNGKLTLGENLADVVGVSVAFDALERAITGKPKSPIDGFTPEQRFFLAYAQALAVIVATKSPADIAALVAFPGVEAQRQALVQKIGENITIRRFSQLQTKAKLAQYVHGGRIGVLVDYEGDDDAGRDVAMHISFSKPAYMTKADVPADVIGRERAILEARARESDKPAEIVAKMVEGGLNKFLAETSLLGQPFVKDDKQTVEKMLAAKKSKLHGYRFLVLGEGLEKRAN